MKYFNTAGPVKADLHYCLDPLYRVDHDELMFLIAQQKYFILHAPRQTGKTSMLLALRDKINSEGDYACVYLNVEPAQTAREDVMVAMTTVLNGLASSLRRDLGDSFLEENLPKLLSRGHSHEAFQNGLSRLVEHLARPLVLLVDEIDSLVGDTLISMLRQMRSGYADRPRGFPQSIILCGVRDLRDYRIQSSSDRSVITGGSAFNVKAVSLRMGDFSKEEAFALLRLHTEETGQAFTDDALEEIWTQTNGQPWLVNALAYEVTFNIKANRDRSVTLTRDMVLDARENLIVRRETHLDQLGDKLKEPRVHRVVAPILAGDMQAVNVLDDDLDYVRDLGLISSGSKVAIANPIYREVIPRMLTWPIQSFLTQEMAWYMDETSGLLDMAKLLEAFQQFFRENSEHWTERFHYKEAGPQLLLQAFLQRVLNGGGRIEREYGLGKGRTDLLVMKPHQSGVQRIVLELKIQRGRRETTVEKALPQISAYMDRCGTDEGHLIIFDRSRRDWDEKIFRDDTQFEGRRVHLWGM